jgi:hypothetical protein
MVRRLHPSVNMQELLTRFSSCGTITGCKVGPDPRPANVRQREGVGHSILNPVHVLLQVFTHKSGRSAGCASVEFASHAQACTALSTMHGTVLCGKAIHVEWFDATAAVSPHGPTATEFKPSSFGSSSSNGGASTRLLQHLLNSNPLGASSGSSSSLLRQASEPLRSSVPCSPGAAGSRRRPSGASGAHPFASKGGSRTGLDSLNGPSSAAAAAAAAALANAMNPAAQNLAALQLLAAAMQPVGLPPMGTPPRVSPLSLSHQHSCPATSLQHLLAQHNWSAAAAAAAAGGMGGGGGGNGGTGYHHPLSPMGGHHGASSSSLLSSSAPGGASLLTRRHSNYTGSSSAAHDAALAAALSSPLGAAAHPHHTAAAMAAATAAAQQQAHNWQAAQQQQQQHQQHQALLFEQQLLMQAQAMAQAAASGGLTRSATSPAELLSEALASLKFLGGEAPASPHGGPPLSPMAAASLLQQQHQQGSGGMHHHCFPPSTAAALGAMDGPAMSAAAAAMELLASTTAGPMAGGMGGTSSSSALLSPFAALAPLMDNMGSGAGAAMEAGRGTSTAGMLPAASAGEAAAAAADALLRSHSQQLRHVMPPVSGLLAPSLSNLDALPTGGSGGGGSDEGAWRAAARRVSAPDSYPGMLPKSPGAAEAAAHLLQAAGGKEERWAGEGSAREAPTGSWGALPPLRGLNVRRRLQPLPSDDLSVKVDTGVGALLGGGGAGAACSSPPVSPQVLSPHDPVSPPPSGSPWLVGGGGSQGGADNSAGLARRNSLPSPLFGTGTGDWGDAVFPFDSEEVAGTPSSSSWGNMGSASGAQDASGKAAAAAAAGLDMAVGEGPSSPLIGTQVSPAARHQRGHALRGVGFGSFCGDLCIEDHDHSMHTLSGDGSSTMEATSSSGGLEGHGSRTPSSDSCQGGQTGQNGPSSVSAASGVLGEALRQQQQQQPRSPGAVTSAAAAMSDADLQLLQAAAGADGGASLPPGQRMLCRHASLGTHTQQQLQHSSAHGGSWAMEGSGAGGAGGHCTAVGHNWGVPGGEGVDVNAWHQPHTPQQQHLLSSLAEMSPEQLQRELASAADSCFAQAAGGGGGIGGGGWSGPQSLPAGGLQGLTRHISMQLDAAVGRLGGHHGGGYGATGGGGIGGSFDWDSSKLEFPGFFSPPPKNLTAGDAGVLDMPVFFGAGEGGAMGAPWQQGRLPGHGGGGFAGGNMGHAQQLQMQHQMQMQLQQQHRHGGMGGGRGEPHAGLSQRRGERESEDSDVGVVATVSTSGGLDAARDAADKVAAGEVAAREGMRTLLRSSSSRY